MHHPKRKNTNGPANTNMIAIEPIEQKMFDQSSLNFTNGRETYSIKTAKRAKFNKMPKKKSY